MSDTERQARAAQRRLLRECEGFLDDWERRFEKRPKDRTFGWNAARNPNVLETIRDGGILTPKTVDKVVAYMRDQRKLWERLDRADAAEAKRKK